jgi:hypothetical protein
MWVVSQLLTIGVLLGVVVLVGWLIVRVRRAHADLRAPAETISLIAAERLVRGSQRSHGLAFLVGTALLAVCFAFGMYSLVTWAWFGGVNLDIYLKARRIAKLLADPAAGAELRGTRLSVGAHGTHATLIVSPRAIRSAKLHAVPESIVR